MFSQTRGEGSLPGVGSLWWNHLCHQGPNGKNLVQIYTQFFEHFSELMAVCVILLLFLHVLSLLGKSRYPWMLYQHFFLPFFASNGLYLGLLKALGDFYTPVKRTKNHITSRKRAEIVQCIGFVWCWTWFGGDGIGCSQREIAVIYIILSTEKANDSQTGILCLTI